MPRSLVIIVATLAAVSDVGARDIYVNNVAGDDRHPGTMERASGLGHGPCRTIARALRAAERGDQIVLANTGVPYRESITLEGGRHSGYPSRPFAIRGNGAGQARRNRPSTWGCPGPRFITLRSPNAGLASLTRKTDRPVSDAAWAR